MEITQDDLNVIELVDLQIAMQAIENKIIVKVDQYKSGYECKECGGSGKIKSTVVEGSFRDCDKCEGKGATLHIPDNVKSLPSTGVIMSMGPLCQSSFLKKEMKEAQTAQNKIDVAIDPIAWDYWKCEIDRIQQQYQACMLHVGTRIVFGTHTGTKIPLRGEIKLTIMTEKEPLCVLFGTNIEDRAILDYTVENV